MVYEKLKAIVAKNYKSEYHIPFSTIFFISSIGKILATFATYPILTVRVRLQADENSKGDILGQLGKIINEIKFLGIYGLFRGIEAKLLQTVLYNAFLMMTYEKLRHLIKVLLF